MYKKLLKIQKEVEKISKESENPFFHSKYFDINKLLDVIKPMLNAGGILLLQPLSEVNGKATIKTILYDTESDTTLEFETPLTENPDPQKMGSAITYYRRYSLQSLLGLQAEDDDGNKASYHKKAEKTDKDPQRTKATSKKFVPENDPSVARNRIQKGFDFLGISQTDQDEWIKESLGCNLYDAKIDKLNVLLERLEKKAKGGKK